MVKNFKKLVRESLNAVEAGFNEVNEVMDAQVQSMPRSSDEIAKWPSDDEICPNCDKVFGPGKKVKDLVNGERVCVHKKCSDGSYTKPNPVTEGIDEDLVEDDMQDAIADIDREGEGELQAIATDYGLDPATVASQYASHKQRTDDQATGAAGQQADIERRAERDAGDKAALTAFNRSAGAKKAAANRKPRAPYYIRSQGHWGNDKKIPVSQDDIVELGHYMMGAAGNVFPDGDPNDELMKFFDKKNWDAQDAFTTLVPAAARKVLDTSSYNEYLANMWDEIFGDAKVDAEIKYRQDGSAYSDPHMYDMLGGPDATNPWR